jgi:hypothetical protein
VRDLRARRRDELLEQASREVALAGGEARHDGVDVRVHDPRGAAEALERREPQDGRSSLRLGPPEAAHDELEIGSVDRARAVAVLHRPTECLQLVEHGVDELRLRIPRPRRGRPGLPDRTLDRLASGLAPERLDPEVVVEEPRDRALEAVELRHRVLAQRDQQVHSGPRTARGGLELRRERRAAVAGRVVREEVLELVQDHERGA